MLQGHKEATAICRRYEMRYTDVKPRLHADDTTQKLLQRIALVQIKISNPAFPSQKRLKKCRLRLAHRCSKYMKHNHKHKHHAQSKLPSKL